MDVKLDIDRDKVVIVWVMRSWDGVPYYGHAWYEDRYCYFTGGEDHNDNQDIIGASWSLYEMEGDVLIAQLAQRKLFEDMVGYHKTKMPSNFKLELVDTEFSTIIKTQAVRVATTDANAYNKGEKWQRYRQTPRVEGMTYLGVFKDVFEQEEDD